MKRIIIGEGSYGCVHKPSIHCKTDPKPDFDYKKYVSKIMKTKNAEQELAEFVTIGKIDPTDEYHLGAPILCKPNLDEENVKDDIKRCKHVKIDDIDANPDKYSLLVLKFGGPDLKALCNKYLVKYLEKDKDIRTDKFWLEVHHLIKGLKFFKDHGIIHNDIKPQNILFDSTNGKMKYIDFGLMRTKKAVIDSSKTNTNYLGIYHWSYPFDCGFMDKKQYANYKDRNDTRRTYWKNSLSELIVADSKSNPLDLPINNPSSFSILFTYINPDNTVPTAATQYGYINSFFDGFNEMIDGKSYETTLNYIADSIDVFGLGFTLQFMANCFKRLNALSLEDFTRLSTFFHKMYDFNPVNRVIDINALLSEYENILLEIGILTRLGKSFKNNMLVNKPPAPPVIIAESKSDEKSPKQHLSPALQEFADKDPIVITVRCPEGKEFNPITKRCVKKCKEGYTRNDKFKCHIVAKKTKKLKSKEFNNLVKSIKSCPSDKELNPRTNRCVKKCKEGFLRNDKFQCRKKVKTTKIFSLSYSKNRKTRSRKSK
jgi:serine/threonine protein kinase